MQVKVLGCMALIDEGTSKLGTLVIETTSAKKNKLVLNFFWVAPPMNINYFCACF